MKAQRKMGAESGFTLLEVMMVLVVGMLIMAGVFALVSQVIGSSKSSDVQQNIASIRSGVKNVYSGESDFDGLDNDVAKISGIVPEKMINGSDEIKNVWGKDVTIEAESGNTSKFRIIYEGVPQEPCVKLSTLTGFDEIAVNGTEVTNVSEATSACDGGDAEISYLTQ